MAGYHVPIGGEFWFSEDILNYHNEQATNEGVLLDGGISAINIIIKEIALTKQQVLLIPKYICPTIVQSLQKSNIQIVFYRIKKDFTIDMQDIYHKMKQYPVKALLFINYFGFFHSDQEKASLRALKQEGVILIEDSVQMMWIDKKKDFIGDYVFNSFRKFVPYDGSFVIGLDRNILDVEDLCETHKITQYDILMKKARAVKTDYIHDHSGNEADYLELFEAAHKAYYEKMNVQVIAEHNRQEIIKLDIDKIRKITKQNYSYLYNRLKECSKIMCLFSINELTDNIPVTFPILVEDRDKIRDEIRKHGVYCPVHWDIRHEGWVKEHSPEFELANTVLGLPIDWRYTEQDMEYVAHCLTVYVK
jgi:dTDP-4-amino-4,6-dideoxygalactose transaminase